MSIEAMKQAGFWVVGFGKHSKPEKNIGDQWVKNDEDQEFYEGRGYKLIPCFVPEDEFVDWMVE
jgi:hypothetical protein